MKALAFSVVLLVVTAGCAGQQTSAPTGEHHTTDHPQGTAIGASFPGVNQGTQTTTATRSTDT